MQSTIQNEDQSRPFEADGVIIAGLVLLLLGAGWLCVHPAFGDTLIGWLLMTVALLGLSLYISVRDGIAVLALGMTPWRSFPLELEGAGP